MNPASVDQQQDLPQFLKGNEAMVQLARSIDWGKTALGPISTWSQSLRTALGIVLKSKFPMFLFWGKELICFYNDAYRPSFGNEGKHSVAFGRPATEVWPEIWAEIKPLLDSVMSGGEATWSEDKLLPIYRNGRLEDAFWTASYSPVVGDDGKPEGVFVVVTETTEKVKSLRKLEESENELRFAIEATELGTYDLNPLTGKFTGNERLKNWFGLDADAEIELSSAIAVMNDADRDRVAAAINRTLQYSSGGFYDIEYSIIHPVTKKETIVRAKGRAWFNEDHVAYRFNGTLQDITGQVMARKELESSEQRFKSLIEEASVPMCLYTGIEMKIDIVNEALLATWGRDKSIVGKRLIEVMPELDGQPFMKMLEEVFTEGVIHSLKDAPTQVMRNGVLMNEYFDLWYQPMLDAKGKIYGILATGVDVTEKVVSRKAVEDSERGFRTMVEQTPVALALTRGNEMLFFNANEPMLKVINRDESIIGKPLIEILPELEGQFVLDVLTKVYETGEPFKGNEVPVILSSNNNLEQRYFDIAYTPLFEEGKVVAVLHSAIDITEQLTIRKKIEADQKDLNELANAMPQLVWVADRDGKITFFNNRVNEFFGAELLPEGKWEWETVIHPDDVMATVQLWSNSVKHGSEYSKEHRIKMKDGSFRWFLSRAYPQRDITGIVVKWFGTATDIDEIKIHEKRKDDFIKMASHELKTPITSMKGYIQLLKQSFAETEDPLLKQSLSTLDRQINKLTKNISDLLDVTRIETGGLALHKTRISMNELINETVNTTRQLAPTHNISINSTVALFTVADKERIEQVLLNLLNNAVKYSTAGSRINISMGVEGKNIKVSIQDFGIGINPTEQKKIFDNFYRVSGREEQTYPGFGIGLFIVSEILKNHGGQVWVESEKSKGAVFYFTLPMAK